MKTNLFSMFDPSSMIGELNWIVLLLLLLYPSYYWLMMNNTMIFFKSIQDMYIKEVKVIIAESNSMKLFLSSLFIMVLTMNLMGILPYVFTATSHLTTIIIIALPSWIGYNLWSMLKTPTMYAAKMLPKGTPLLLTPFMILIEILSNFIRPLTLSVRLMANMVAGHLLLCMLSNSILQLSLSLILLTSLMMFLLMLMELGVCSIQAYVFTTLTTLYLAENNNPSN